ncbi:alpha-ketoglutarate-dependent dioxygenase AlkB family protein [Vibrio superstes]|nr:alpha-ketoglutarate-dependent dioxygenase AlkB [Vibrio superstes]
MSLFPETENGWQQVEQGRIYWQPDFFTSDVSRQLFERLYQTLPWEQGSIKMYGKSIPQPRLHAFCGDVPYRYSGLTLQPSAWTKELSQIKQLVEEAAGQSFNTVLVNLYRDGQDSMGWHKDNEKELGTHPMIASVSFGATRRFVLRHCQSKTKLEFLLKEGALLIMAGELQEYWQHSVPKTTKISQSRINLTFRNVIG